MNLTFASSGAVTSLVDRASGRDVLSPEAAALLTVSFPPRLCPHGHMGACPPCLCRPVPASRLDFRGNVLLAEVPMAGNMIGPAELEVAMAIDQGFPREDSLLFSVVSLSCTNCTDLDNWREMARMAFLNLSLAMPNCAADAARRCHASDAQHTNSRAPKRSRRSALA